MEEPPSTNPQAPFPSARRFGVPVCWIFFAIGATPLVAMIGLDFLEALDTLITGSAGRMHLFLRLAVVGYLCPAAWVFAIASFATALVRMAKIRRYNRMGGTSERGVVSATVCACLSTIEIVIPLLLLGLLLVKAA